MSQEFPDAALHQRGFLLLSGFRTNLFRSYKIDKAGNRNRENQQVLVRCHLGRRGTD